MKSKNKTVELVYIATLIAISFIGSLIKIQGTIALDSMPGFFAALYLDPLSGALVGGIGHLLTSLTSGFPLTLPIHLIITLQMAVFIYIFGLIYKNVNGIIASIIAIILNGIGATLILAPITVWIGLPLSGTGFIYAMALPLTIASAVNVILAVIIYKVIKKSNF
ncbi:MAG TPA: ECF transporter S component [Tissierellaceae bacterium]|nr:ECF transporter S component [Tissierellaceae bacterium]